MMRELLRGSGLLNGIFVLGLGTAIALPMAASSVPVAAARPSMPDGGVAAFYRARGGAPLWFAPNSGAAQQQLISLLATSQADHLNPRGYNVKALQRAVDDARGGGAGAVQRAELMLSQAFVAYARDQRHDPGGIIYVDAELKPTPPSATELLNAAARAPSLSDYVQNMGWMNPIYA
ncbi:MAG TPA: hypothetical protein VG434_00670, partial [Sphingomicrobium sp.]|nr:hypothetical protein [Sphingomicrobium sp.]